MTQLNDAFFFLISIIIVGTFIYKLINFFNFKTRSFWENIINEGSIFVTITFLGYVANALSLLNVTDLTYSVMMRVLVICGSLLVAIQLVTILMSFKTLLSDKEPQGTK